MDRAGIGRASALKSKPGRAPHPPTRPPSRFRSGWGRAELAAAILAAVCYVNVLPNEYTDDGVHIAQHNPQVVRSGGWGEIWTTDYWADQRDRNPNRDLLYRPLAVSSFKLVRSIAGAPPWPQLLTNILLHALITVLTVRLCRHLGGGVYAAWATGLVFAVMPIHVEVIANVVGRADMLAAAGVLLAALAHRRSRVCGFASGGDARPTGDARVTGGAGPAAGRDARPTEDARATEDNSGGVDSGSVLLAKTRWRLVASLAAFAAMSAKESGVAVLPVIVLMDLAVQVRHRDRLAPSGGGALSRLWGGWLSLRTVGRLSYIIAPAAAYLTLRFHALGGVLHQRPAVSKTVNVLVDAPTWQHWLGVVQLWGMYWGKTIWPAVLSVNYSINTIRLARSALDPQFLFGAAVTIGLIAWSILAWRRGVIGVAMALAIVVACYAPTSNALVLIQVFFAERIWYLPSIGVAVLAGFAASRVVRHRPWAIVGCVLVGAMLVRCWVRNEQWHDNGTLYGSAYHAHPDAVGARLLYGTWLANEGHDEEGVELMNAALEIDFGYTDVHRALGRAHLQAGRFEKALHHLQIADVQIPDDPGTVERLAIAREMVYRKHRDEVAALRRAAAENPDDIDAEIALLKKLRSLDLRDEALTRLAANESRFGGRIAWEREYIDTLVYAAKPDEAIRRYERVIADHPDDAPLKAELAALLMERDEAGDLDRAWTLIEEATRIAPNNLSVLICRADLLALRGALDEATSLLRGIVSALSPQHPLHAPLQEKLRTLGG